jgi:hypothetical protein
MNVKILYHALWYNYVMYVNQKMHNFQINVSIQFLHKCMETYYLKPHVQTVFLTMNTRCSKHVEDDKNWIKTLIWKVCILQVYIS